MLGANVPFRHLSFVKEASFLAFAAIHFLFGGIFGKFCDHHDHHAVIWLMYSHHHCTFNVLYSTLSLATNNSLMNKFRVSYFQ